MNYSSVFYTEFVRLWQGERIDLLGKPKKGKGLSLLSLLD